MTIRSKFLTLLTKKEQEENRRITLVDISNATGIDQRTLSQYLKNKIQRYDAFVLDRLCKYFGCEVGDLIVYIPDENKEGGE